MNPAHDEQWRALRDAVSEIERRQAELERRLSHLEGRAPAPPPVETLPEPPPAAPRPELETRMGLTWINRIGVVTLVLGVAFFFKYAVDNRWIGETGRVVLGVAAGLAAIGLGEYLWRGGQRIYAQGISGAGIAILYVSFYASAGFYHVLQVPTAFAMMTLVTLGAAALSVRYGSSAIAALGLIGGYETPLVLNARAAGPWFFLSYVLLLDAGACLLARRRKWRFLEVLAFAATVFLFSTQAGWPPRAGDRAVLTIFNLLYAALFTTVAGRVVPALALANGMAWAWAIWSGGPAGFSHQAAFLVMSLALAGVHAVRVPARERSLVSFSGIAAAFLVFAVPAIFPGYQMTIAWSALAALLAWSAGKTAGRRWGDATAVVLLFVALRLYGSDFGAAARGPRFMTFLVAAAVFWAAAWWMGRGVPSLIYYVSGHFHLLWILGAEVLDWNLRTTPRESLPSVNSASISILMAAYALLLVAGGVAARSGVNRVLGLALTGVVILKLYLWDVWQLSRIYRFSAFALLGLILLLTSYLYSRFRAARSGQ